jgi:hypothetical protein
MGISSAELQEVREHLRTLIGVHFDLLKLPRAVLAAFEPSQIGTIVGTLMDACIPHLSQIIEGNETLAELGISKHPGVVGEREGYPDYLHGPTGKRLELKLIYVDPSGVEMKRPPTPRESSARLTQKVTVKNVEPDKDVLLVIAYQLRPGDDNRELFSPTIIDLEVFSMIECIRARDSRLSGGGGYWMGDYETPVVLSQKGRRAHRAGEALVQSYGRKASEGHHYNEDTNFGKLARIPYPPLQRFLSRFGVKPTS